MLFIITVSLLAKKMALFNSHVTPSLEKIQIAPHQIKPADIKHFYSEISES